MSHVDQRHRHEDRKHPRHVDPDVVREGPSTSSTSRTILTTPKMPFSTSTQNALRSPTRTLSCSVNMAQTTTQTTKMRAGDRAVEFANRTRPTS